MKRDPSLIKSLLLKVEESPAGQSLKALHFDGCTEEDVIEHIELLLEAGFIKGVVILDVSGQPTQYSIQRLTWEGHEFLCNAKNDTVWKKALSLAQEKGLSISVSVLSALLLEGSKVAFGLGK
jgi:Hypothetical protein (DUF2513)